MHSAPSAVRALVGMFAPGIKEVKRKNAASVLEGQALSFICSAFCDADLERALAGLQSQTVSPEEVVRVIERRARLRPPVDLLWLPR